MKRELWASDEESDLERFRFPEGGKIFFAENEAQANQAFEAIQRGEDPALLAVVRSAEKVKKL